MEQSEKAKEFLAALDPEALQVGDGSDGRPVWIGIDAEAQRVYTVSSNGLATGFGDGVLHVRTGLGPHAGELIEQTTTDERFVIFDAGSGPDRTMNFLEIKPEFLQSSPSDPEMELDQVLFELRGPDGHTWTLTLDGRCTGFPPGTTMMNLALPLTLALVGKMKRQGVGLTAEATDAARASGPKLGLCASSGAPSTGEVR